MPLVASKIVDATRNACHLEGIVNNGKVHGESKGQASIDVGCGLLLRHTKNKVPRPC